MVLGLMKCFLIKSDVIIANCGPPIIFSVKALELFIVMIMKFLWRPYYPLKFLRRTLAYSPLGTVRRDTWILYHCRM